MTNLQTRLVGMSKFPLSIQTQGRIVRVALVDTHVLMCMALHHVVDTLPQVEIVAVLDTAHEILDRTGQEIIDVAVFGISIPIADCLHFANYLRREHMDMEIVVIRTSLHPEMVQTLVKQGIHGLLDKDASEQDLADAIFAVRAGSVYLNRHARDMLADSLSARAIHLTAREIEVISLLKRGKSNFHIAQALGMKEKTVEAHLTRIYSKLGVNSRAEAIVCFKSLDV